MSYVGWEELHDGLLSVETTREIKGVSRLLAPLDRIRTTSRRAGRGNSFKADFHSCILDSIPSLIFSLPVRTTRAEKVRRRSWLVAASKDDTDNFNVQYCMQHVYETYLHPLLVIFSWELMVEI